MPKFLTHQNIELDIELASVGDRVVATIIDGLILAAIYIVLLLITLGVGSGGYFAFILFIPMFFYTLLFEIFGNGQTPGKRARNIKVVKMDGGSAKVGQYILRWMFRLVDVYILYGAPGLIAMATSKNGQRLGDMVAGTTVIRIREASKNRVFTPKIEEDYEIKFPNAWLLTDEQIDLMKKALKMLQEQNNHMGVIKMAEKLKETLNVESDLPDRIFLETVIKDYEYIANQ